MTVLFTDPHLGVNRVANTTPTSRQLLRQRIRDNVMGVIGRAEDEKLICLGDLFDTYHNDEATLLDAFPIVERLDFCLAGNHDLVSAKNQMGSLELFHHREPSQQPSTFCYLPFGVAGYQRRRSGNCAFYAVPHCTTQALFEESIESAWQAAGEEGEDMAARYLLLHANYNLPWAEVDETSINLTEEHLKKLLLVFDYVVMGHEHNQRDLFDGRLVILGNTFPTSFADMADKRFMWVDDETGAYSFETIWNMDTRYLCTTPEELDPAGYPDVEFIRVSGFLATAETKRLTDAVKKIWANSPRLIGLKIDVEMEGMEALNDGSVAKLEDLPTLIRGELGDSPVGKLWAELLAEVTEEHTS